MAEFKVAAIFSNNMVLQREKNIKVFGQGKDNDTVTVSFLGNTYTGEVKNEKWLVQLPSMKAGTGYQMIVGCGNQRFTFENIAIGEVWLAGGQSNMEFELQNCTGGKEMLQYDQSPNVRFYYTFKTAYRDEHFLEGEEHTKWCEFSEENAKKWSAVGYIYGKRIAAELGVTVGIISCNWGGTSAACWISKKCLEEDEELKIYLEEFQKVIEDKTEEEQLKDYIEYKTYHEEWDLKCIALHKYNPDVEWEEVIRVCGECQYPGPKNSFSPFRPAGLYHSMLQRVMPYTLRGFLYYQGEEDIPKAHIYQKLLTRLITKWREDWEDETLPFLLTQITMHRFKSDPDSKSWCYLREAQMNTYQSVSNTGIAIIIDSGEFNDIHPKDKRPVGERLALLALYLAYQKISEKDAYGPIYQGFEYKDGGMEFSFRHAQEGFVLKGEPVGFEIAGEDLQYEKADIALRGSKIFISSPKVSNPRYGRYLWTDYGPVTIYGRNGIPLAPFRTGEEH